MSTPVQGPSAQSRRRLTEAFFLIAFVGLAWLMVRILAPFLATIAAAVLLAIVLDPVHARILRLVRGRANVAAGLSTLLVLVAVVLPLGAGAWFLVSKTVEFLPDAHDWVQGVLEFEGGHVRLNLPENLESIVERGLDALRGWGIDPADVMRRVAESVGPSLAAFGARTLRAVPGILFGLVVLLVATFFVFRDGARIYRWLLDLLPMDPRHAEKIFGRLDATLIAIVRGALITALVQGLVATLGFVLVRAPFALLLGCAATVLAFIPVVGTAAVWLPVAIYLMVSGRPLAGTFLIAWGILVVSLIDNFLRPKLVGDRANLPLFALLFCTLGGLKVFGPAGALVGPMALAAFLAFASIFVEQWRRAPKGEGAAGDPPAERAPAPQKGKSQSKTHDSE